MERYRITFRSRDYIWCYDVLATQRSEAMDRDEALERARRLLREVNEYHYVIPYSLKLDIGAWVAKYGNTQVECQHEFVSNPTTEWCKKCGWEPDPMNPGDMPESVVSPLDSMEASQSPSEAPESLQDETGPLIPFGGEVPAESQPRPLRGQQGQLFPENPFDPETPSQL